MRLVRFLDGEYGGQAMGSGEGLAAPENHGALQAWAHARGIRPARPQAHRCMAVDGRPQFGRTAAPGVVQNLQRAVNRLQHQVDQLPANDPLGERRDALTLHVRRLEARVRALGVPVEREPEIPATEGARIIPLRRKAHPRGPAPAA